MRKLYVGSLITSFALSGCAASAVSQYYHEVPHRSVTAATTAEPEIRPSSGNAKDDVAINATNGWELVGYSAFNGPEAGRVFLIAQAKQVGAGLVISGAKYTDTINTGTFGSTTFTRYGAFSMAIPTSVRRYDQVDLFFAKAPHIGLGTYVQALKPEEHAAIGTNKGLRVTAIINGSPAFQADILAGDIILSINEIPIYDRDSYHAAAEAAYGKRANLAILRNGQSLQKVVDLPPGGNW